MNCPFSEKYLQIIWNERMLSTSLQCTDGRKVQILFPGLWQRRPGPDFSDAALLLDGVPVRGSIEIHRRPSDWFAHGHHTDPAYGNVVLHAVWNAAPDERAPEVPTLLMEPHLQQSWKRIMDTVNASCYPRAREIPPGACFMRWALTDDDAMQKILMDAGWARFCRRSRAIMEAWGEKERDQVLYELTFEGLGYSANRENFLSFARATPLEMLSTAAEGDLTGILLGRGGLLPDVTAGDKVCRELEDTAASAWHLCWSAGISPLQIPWAANSGRPQNSVLRRMAAGAFWLTKCRMRPARWLEEALAQSADGAALLETLLGTGTPEEQLPWSAYRDFTAPMPSPALLLGRERLGDLALNIWLPYLAAAAEAADSEKDMSIVREAWRKVPRTQENHLLKEAVHRFLTPPSRSRQLLKHAAQQQGMMDIYKNFCLALQHSCNDCPFVVKP